MAEPYQPPTFVKAGSSQAEPDGFDWRQKQFSNPQKSTGSFNIEKLEKRRPAPDRENHADFDSTKFNKVETLLTNVEEYSKRIRKDVDQYARRTMEDVDLLKSECELELAQALICKKEARSAAEKLIQEAKDKRDRFVEEAKKEGYDAGYAAGAKECREKNERDTRNVLTLLKELNDLRMSVLHQHERQIVQLSLMIAKKVIHTQANTDKRLILNMVKKILTRFEGMGDIRIAVNPIEYDFLAEHQPEIERFLDGEQDVKVRRDANVKPAAARIESSFTAVEFDLETQLKEIENHLKECTEERRQVLSPQ